MVALVPDHVLQQEDRVVVVKVHATACLHPGLYRVPDRLGALVQHLRDATNMTLDRPLFLGQVSGKLGGVLGDQHESHIVDVYEQLRDGWAAQHRPSVKFALRECAVQVEQDGIVAVPGVEQSLKQVLVWCVHNPYRLGFGGRLRHRPAINEILYQLYMDLSLGTYTSGGVGMVSLSAYEWLAISAKDELCTTSRDVDRRCCLRHASRGTGWSEHAAGEYGAGKSMGLRREHQRVSGAARAIVCVADIHSGPQHAPLGSAVQLRGAAYGIVVGGVQPEHGEQVAIGSDAHDRRRIWPRERNSAGAGIYGDVQESTAV